MVRPSTEPGAHRVGRRRSACPEGRWRRDTATSSTECCLPPSAIGDAAATPSLSAMTTWLCSIISSRRRISSPTRQFQNADPPATRTRNQNVHRGYAPARAIDRSIRSVARETWPTISRPADATASAASSAVFVRCASSVDQRSSSPAFSRRSFAAFRISSVA